MDIPSICKIASSKKKIALKTVITSDKPVEPTALVYIVVDNRGLVVNILCKRDN